MRLNLNPNAVEGGNGAAQAAASQGNDLVEQLAAFITQRKAVETKTVETKSAPAAETTTETKADGPPDVREWLRSIEEKLTARDLDDKSKQEAAEKDQLQKQLSKLIGDGDVAKLKEVLGKYEQHFSAKLGEKETVLKAKDVKLQAYVKRTVLAETLTGWDFAGPVAAKDAISKIDGFSEVQDDARGEPSVVEKGTGRPIAEAIKARLDAGEFDHFLKAGSRGKGGTGNGSSANPTGGSARPGDLVGQIAAALQSNKGKILPNGLSAGLF